MGDPVRGTPAAVTKKPGIQVRKSYVAPSLVEYGSIGKLTQGGTGTGTDGGSGGKAMQCL